MRFGVHLVAAGKMIEGEKIARVARRAEELGYDSLWVSDHIVFPTQLRSPYPYSPDGKLPLDPTNPLLEPFTVLSYAAAVKAGAIKAAPGRPDTAGKLHKLLTG